MAEKLGSTAWAMVFVIFMFLQVVFAFADNVETPNRAATAFAKAYYRLDPDMANRICEDALTVDDTDLVEQFIFVKTEEARKRGFDVSWMKRRLYHIETKMLSRDDTTATVHLTGTVRMEINPVYAWVASLFALGDTHHVDHVFEMVYENGRWKVCGTIGRLTQI